MKKKWFFIVLTILFVSISIFIEFRNKYKDKYKRNSYDIIDPDDCQKVKDIKKRGFLHVGIKVDVLRFGFLDSKTNREEGIEPDISRAIAFEIFRDENAVKFRPITQKTRGALLDNGELDFVAATFTVTENRKKSYSFTDEDYYSDYITFLVNINSGFKSIFDLAGKNIGVSQSTPTKRCLQEKGKELGIEFNFSEYTSYHELKTALATGRIDAFSADKSILIGYLDENSVILNDAICKQKYSIACKLENKDFCEYLNKIIKKMKNNGQIDTLIKKWNLQ
ncbi:MAG: transporter substrate-binding domain-containing protein [Firmicutes bacterium]|nr:transporter substrate-binding domain-containing protein [Bacillota bacterium]